jgi:hypothetical protein
MQEKVLRKKVTKDNFYNSYLKCFNGYLNLTPRELEVVVELCNTQAQNINLNYSPEQLSKLVFGPTSRENIRTKLSISPYNLNNIIKILKGKGVILTTVDKYYILNPQLYIPLTDNEYWVNYKLELV